MLLVPPEEGDPPVDQENSKEEHIEKNGHGKTEELEEESQEGLSDKALDVLQDIPQRDYGK